MKSMQLQDLSILLELFLHSQTELLGFSCQ